MFWSPLQDLLVLSNRSISITIFKQNGCKVNSSIGITRADPHCFKILFFCFTDFPLQAPSVTKVVVSDGIVFRHRQRALEKNNTVLPKLHLMMRNAQAGSQCDGRHA